MAQTKKLSELVKATSTLPTSSWSSTPQTLSANLQKRGKIVVSRFGSDKEFMLKVNPDTHISFGGNPRQAYMGDYPTLNDIDAAYGKGFSVEWMLPHIANVAMHTGAKNLTVQQELELARIIATEYRHLKVTELLLFFYKFKTGAYGRFYGSVDPMVITCALREFNRERGDAIDKYMQEDREAQAERERKENPPITREEWERIKDTYHNQFKSDEK